MTLREENVLWLKGQAAASGKGSVSEVVDALVSAVAEREELARTAA